MRKPTKVKIVLEVLNEQHAAALLAVAAHKGYINVPVPHPKIGWAFPQMQSMIVSLFKEVETDGRPIQVPD